MSNAQARQDLIEATVTALVDKMTDALDQAEHDLTVGRVTTPQTPLAMLEAIRVELAHAANLVGLEGVAA